MPPSTSTQRQIYSSGLCSAGADRFGFNGQERTNEIAGAGNHNTALFWEYDTRLGRRWKLDPLAFEKPWMSSYHGLANNPILNIDPSGASETWYVNKNGEVLAHTDDGSNDIVLIPDDKVEDFEYYGGAINIDPSLYNSQEWNKNQKSNYELYDKQLSYEQSSHLNELNSEWSRTKAVEYFLNPTIANYSAFAFSEMLSQWTNPSLVLTGLSMLEVRSPIARTNSNNTRPSSLATSINSELQGRHIVDHPNYIVGRSTLNVDAQKLLDGIHSGQYTILRNHQNNFIVDFGSPIGIYYKNGNPVGPTQFGSVHYGQSGAYIVPANPVQY